MTSTISQYNEYISRPITQPTETLADRYFNESSQMLHNEMDNAVAQLTQDDKLYLAMK